MCLSMVPTIKGYPITFPQCDFLTYIQQVTRFNCLASAVVLVVSIAPFERSGLTKFYKVFSYSERYEQEVILPWAVHYKFNAKPLKSLINRKTFQIMQTVHNNLHKKYAKIGPLLPLGD